MKVISNLSQAEKSGNFSCFCSNFGVILTQLLKRVYKFPWNIVAFRKPDFIKF